MKMVPVRFFYLRARIFGWIIMCGIIAYVVSALYQQIVQ